VDALGGVQWAAAILGTTSESITQWLMAGTVTKERAPLLARAALQKGVRVDLLKLLYGEVPQLEPVTPTAKAGKGAKMPGSWVRASWPCLPSVAAATDT